jgi:hypothetical protein
MNVKATQPINRYSEPYNAEKLRPRGQNVTTKGDLLAGIQFLKNLTDLYDKQ